MDLEEKIIAYKTLAQQIETLEKQKRDLSREIISLMPDKKVDVSGYRVYRYTRLSISLPLEQARLFGATKMTEQVDREKIKELYNQGREMDGVKESSYILVKDIQNSD